MSKHDGAYEAYTALHSHVLECIDSGAMPTRASIAAATAKVPEMHQCRDCYGTWPAAEFNPVTRRCVYCQEDRDATDNEADKYTKADYREDRRMDDIAERRERTEI